MSCTCQVLQTYRYIHANINACSSCRSRYIAVAGSLCVCVVLVLQLERTPSSVLLGAPVVPEILFGPQRLLCDFTLFHLFNVLSLRTYVSPVPGGSNTKPLLLWTD